MEDEKRKNKRLRVDGYLVQFNDNDLLYTGVVENVSLTGLRVKFCRRNTKLMVKNSVSWERKPFEHRAPEYRLVFSTKPDGAPAASTDWHKAHNSSSYALAARPRWKAKTDDVTRIGFNITRYSEDWRQFVLQILPMRSLLPSPALAGPSSQGYLAHPSAVCGGKNCPERKYCKDHDKSLAGGVSDLVYGNVQAR
ncbi:MAG: PilZ domain-containing protein [Candidatus Electrothrix scaldis]|nr:MAG: PilZ domain-containing protein [Candidatus Electrothrix sp. GW3-3]